MSLTPEVTGLDVARQIRTRLEPHTDEMVVLLSQLVRIESGDGELIEMGPDGTLFRAMRDMTIEAPGHTIRIRAAKVDFERA